MSGGGGDARERIVAAAGRLLAAGGAAGGAPAGGNGTPGTGSVHRRDGTLPSVGKVAAAAGVSRATVYRYFPTRSALLVAAGSRNAGPPPGDARRAVLEAALDVFVERGIHAATLRAIATRAGLTLSGLHWHFKTKEELVAGLVEYLPLLSTLQREAAVAGTADLETQLTHIAGVVLGTLGSRPGLARLMLCEASVYPDVHRLLLHQGAGRGLPVLVRLFDEHARRGELRPGSSAVRAQAFLGLMLVSLLVRPLLRELVPGDDGEAVREYVRIVVRGVLATPGEG